MYPNGNNRVVSNGYSESSIYTCSGILLASFSLIFRLAAVLQSSPSQGGRCNRIFWPHSIRLNVKNHHRYRDVCSDLHRCVKTRLKFPLLDQTPPTFRLLCSWLFVCFVLNPIGLSSLCVFTNSPEPDGIVTFLYRNTLDLVWYR